MEYDKISKLLENFDILYNNYNETEYSRKILLNLIQIIYKCIIELEKIVKISQNLQNIKQEISSIQTKYDESPMVFKKKSKLIIADENYNITALTKELIKNYYDNFISELKIHLKNGR